MTTGFDRRNERGSDDPTSIRSLAVTVDDVLSALEARQRADRPAVLRVTPPFVGRMRARLHLVGGEGTYDDGPTPLHLPPERFVEDSLSSVPSVDDTEDALRERGEYTVERHREEHAAAVEAWRDEVRSSLVSEVSLAVDDGVARHTVEVRYLGRRGE